MRPFPWLLIASFLAGCGGTPDLPTDPEAVASVTITAPATTLEVGTALQLTATLRGADQSVLAGRMVTWLSEDEGHATVSTGGVVTAVAEGSARIVAGSEGQSGAITLTIAPSRVPVATISVTPVPADFGPGMTAQLTATIRDAEGGELHGRAITWSSSVPAVASVSSAGLLTAIRPGSVTIMAESEGHSGSASGTIQTLTFSDIYASNSYSCGVTTAQHLYCWGANLGQFGNNSTSSSLVPMLSAGGEQYIAVGTSRDSDGYGFFTCGIRSAGALYCWGNNLYGQLGDGTNTNRTSPLAVPTGESFIQVSTGNTFACAVTAGGAAFCWGSNASGQLGRGGTSGPSSPAAVLGGIAFQSVSAGTSHTCGLATDGVAYCWGSNSDGQLGTGDSTSSSVPVAVSGGHTFARISAGGRYTCGVTDTHVGYCWGSDGNYGALGTGTHAGAPVPAAVAGGLNFSAIETSGFESVTTHTCGVSTGGEAYCWGDQAIGDGTGNGTLVPRLVAGGHTWLKIAAGDVHSCGVTTKGVAYCWGFYAFGNLGTESTTGTTTPAKVGYQP